MKQKPKRDKSITFFENQTKQDEPPLRKMRKFRNLEEEREETIVRNGSVKKFNKRMQNQIEIEMNQTKRRYSTNIESNEQNNNSSECSSILEDINSLATSEIDSNRSDGMSQADIDFDRNYDELSELWEQSSINSQNSQQSGQKKILRYMHIKSLSDDENNEYVTRTKDMILPVFEQLEQQSQRFQPLVSLKVAAPSCQNCQVHHEKEEADCFFHGHNGIEGDDCPNIMRDPTSVRSGRRLKLNKIRRKMKTMERQVDTGGGGGSNQTNDISMMNATSIATISVDYLIKNNFKNQPDKPPVTVYDAFIRLSFNLMDRQVRESAQQRALQYLSHIPKESTRYTEVLNMVSEVYRIMILPDEVLKIYTNSLSLEQKKIEGIEIIKKINPRLNKHHFKQQVLEKIRRHYLI